MWDNTSGGTSWPSTSLTEVSSNIIVDLQDFAKKKGFPWTMSKGQDNFCPVSPIF